MSLSDPLGDMLTRIRNAQRAGHATVKTPASKLRMGVLEVLKKEGFIRAFDRIQHEQGKAEISIELKYYEGGPVIKMISRVSSPGRRVYSSIKDLPKVSNGLGIAILSTSRGVMSDSEARTAHIGGEVLCQVF